MPASVEKATIPSAHLERLRRAPTEKMQQTRKKARRSRLATRAGVVKLQKHALRKKRVPELEEVSNIDTLATEHPPW